ncbi:hypothetical protein [Dyadobacter psychrotolerans]|jgi:hypothetical protein|uniref:Uncharacterized protein n=1 Tax=Dyadobacter psychrotolerans TaxID=2541721 RepID=A0A4R5D8E6_9BACT|nr:hypothetical protein [Dyadobacter psychrotolerans]TDE09832.1 hypothetical protein E0F88_30030 [Dyadobacter psychrotolerans]
MKTITYTLMLLALAFVLVTELLNFKTSIKPKPVGQLINKLPSSTVKSDSVKAAILEKVHIPKTKFSDEQFLLVYKNVNGEVWKIENSLPFWGAGEKNDSVWVYFSNENRRNGYITYLDVRPMK